MIRIVHFVDLVEKNLHESKLISLNIDNYMNEIDLCNEKFEIIFVCLFFIAQICFFHMVIDIRSRQILRIHFIRRALQDQEFRSWL